MEECEEEYVILERTHEELEEDEVVAKLALEKEKAKAKLEALNTKLDLEKNEVVKAKHAMEKAEAESESLKTELASVKVELTELQSRLEVNRSELESLKAKLVLEKNQNEALKAKQAMAESKIVAGAELDSAKLEACDARNKLELLKAQVLVEDYKLREIIKRNATMETSLLELYYVHGYRDAKRERVPLFDIPQALKSIN